MLLARLREIYEHREDALAAALAAETGDNGIGPRVAAAQLTAAHRMLVREAFRRMADGETEDDLAAALAAAAGEAFGLLEPALNGYAVR